MASSKKAKTKLELPPSEAASLLRQLADALDAGTVSFNQKDLELTGLVKVSESLKSKDGSDQLEVKLKIVSAAPVSPETTEPAGAEPAPKAVPKDKGKGPSYKSLKKELAKHFKEIRQAAQEGNMPPAQTVAEFCRLARQMITFPGKGDEHYAAFGDAVTTLESAAAGEDPAAVAAAHATLKEMRSSCHGKYK